MKLVCGIFLLPLLVSLFVFLLRKKIPHSLIALISVAGAFATFILCLFLSLIHFNSAPLVYSFDWIELPGSYNISSGIYIDNLSLAMLVLVSGISLLVQFFSVEYMKGDSGYGRYFACLSFFTFSMLGILVAPNLLIIFVFWELVGFASYLLIGFWFSKESASQASKKAFIVNRVGDIGFLLGVLIIWSVFKTLDLEELKLLLSDSPNISQSLIFLAGLGLFAGCVGKSAQFPLQIWLPDAMEGPTPVSALIHAATMVAAGVFLLAKVFFILNLDVLTIIAFVGAITAFMGAIAALKQYDIKKVLAYSTISQLGYMVMAMGIGAYQASLFHLMTHAFFKAGLFLCAGSVIHSLHTAGHRLKNFHFDAQDMRSMGGLRKQLPVTFIIYCLTAASLAGIPFTSGFLSKDAIVLNSIAWSGVMADKIGMVAYFIPLISLLTVFLTAFYMARQIFLVFFGEFRLEKIIPDLSSFKMEKEPLTITLPLLILGLFSLFFMFSVNPLSPENSFIYDSLGRDIHLISTTVFEDKNIYFHQIHEKLAGLHTITLITSVLLVGLGIALASKLYYRKDVNFDKTGNSALEKLSLNNWYLDSIYNKTIVRFVVSSSEATKKIDKLIIDPFLHLIAYFTVISALVVKVFDKLFVDGLVNGSVFMTGRLGVLARSFQGGKVQYFFITVIISLVLLIYLTAF